MNFVLKPLGVIGGILLVGSQLFAVVPERYQTILDRNAFGLLPPPVQTQDAAPVASPVDIKVTGFATIGGERRVYFTIPPKTPKDHYQYLTLSDGQIEAGIEVISISESDAAVRVRNAGIEIALSLKDNGFQSAKGPVAVAQTQPSAPMPSSQKATYSANQHVSSPVYNPYPARLPTIAQSSPVAGAGRVRGTQPAAMQVASHGNGSGTGGNVGLPLVSGTSSSTPGILPTPENPSPVYGANIDFPVDPIVGGQLSRTSQPKFPAERTFDSPEEAAIIAAAEEIHNQNPRTRAEWEAYYRNMGWPEDRPFPMDVAAALSPAQ